MDLQAIRRAVADTIRDNIDRAVNVYAYPPSSPRFPWVLVEPTTGTYHETMGDRAIAGVDFTIWIGAAARPEDSLALIDDMLSSGHASTSSVVDALEADPTFGAAVQSSWVESFQYVPGGDENAPVFAASLLFHVFDRRG